LRRGARSEGCLPRKAVMRFLILLASLLLIAAAGCAPVEAPAKGFCPYPHVCVDAR